MSKLTWRWLRDEEAAVLLKVLFVCEILRRFILLAVIPGDEEERNASLWRQEVCKHRQLKVWGLRLNVPQAFRYKMTQNCFSRKHAPRSLRLSPYVLFLGRFICVLWFNALWTTLLLKCAAQIILIDWLIDITRGSDLLLITAKAENDHKSSKC